MDISQYQTQNTNTLFIIQRAQRVLDETEAKMKKFKKQKQSASKPTCNSSCITSPLPDIKEYLSYLINEPQMSDSFNMNKKGMQATAQIRRKPHENYLNFDEQLHNHKKTEKAEMQNGSSIKGGFDDLDLRRHTQEQLNKQQSIRLKKIEAIYGQKCEQLDKKISSLQGKRQKIKRDKVLLMRNNQQLEQRIDSARHKQQHTQNKQIPDSRIVQDLKKQIDRLMRKINKIEGENTKIIKKKQDLQANMRVCIRNSKQQLFDNIPLQRPKSQSRISHKCLYH